MPDSATNGAQSLNPLVLHLQKLALELKCALCLNLFRRPLLLPCDHIFCNSCIPRSAECGSECPLCKSHCTEADLRPLDILENVVAIYKGLAALSGSNLFQSVSSVFGRPQDDNSSCGHLVSANKLGQILFDDSANGGKSERTELPARGENKCNGDQNSNLAQPSSEPQAGGIQDYRAVQIDSNHLEQFSPCSPSFGDIKGSDNDNSSGQGCEHSLKNCLANRSAFRRSLASTSEIGGPLRGSKRLKRSGKIQSTVFPNESSLASNSDLELKSGVPLACESMPPISDYLSENKNICGFCQTSKISKVTGSMLHYANGKAVVGEEADLPYVIHVHSRCFEWAPKVYYDGDTVKNLKAELSRGSKLKCSKCGQKGAVLGCYVQSCRRSYHFPCAVEIPKCRWDYENYLVLCPAHASVKFPKEKSGNCSIRNHIVPPRLTPQLFSFWAASPIKEKEWVFCGSALSVEEKLLLIKFGSMIGVPVLKFWKPNVTHVIASTDANGSCTRTLKVLMAILNGSWVLNIDWIKACMDAMHPVGEEPYEVNLDNHGCEYGPRTGRLRVLKKEPKLFDGLSFYFSGDFLPGYKEDLQSLVITAGATIWESEEELLAQCCHGKAAPTKVFVVYNLDSPQVSLMGDEGSTIWKRLNQAEELATKIGSRAIGHAWLLESIAEHKLPPLLIQ